MRRKYRVTENNHILIETDFFEEADRVMKWAHRDCPDKYHELLGWWNGIYNGIRQYKPGDREVEKGMEDLIILLQSEITNVQALSMLASGEPLLGFCRTAPGFFGLFIYEKPTVVIDQIARYLKTPEDIIPKSIAVAIHELIHAEGEFLPEIMTEGVSHAMVSYLFPNFLDREFPRWRKLLMEWSSEFELYPRMKYLTEIIKSVSRVPTIDIK